MNPLVTTALASILRWLFAFAAGWLVQHGVWTQADASTYVAAAALGVLGLGWSMFEKYKSRIKFLTALSSPAGTTETSVNNRIANGMGAPLLGVLLVGALGLSAGGLRAPLPNALGQNFPHAIAGYSERSSDRSLVLSSCKSGANLVDLRPVQFLWSAATAHGLGWQHVALARHGVERDVERNADLQSVCERIRREPVSGGHVSNYHISTIDRDVVVATSIPVLFRPKSPTAVARRIRPVVVDSVDGVLWRRRLSHVGKEAFERREPFSANRDATASVVAIGGIIRPQTAGLYPVPCPVFLRASHIVGVANTFACDAPAGLRGSGIYAFSKSIEEGAAIATTPPSRMAALA